MTKKKIPKNSNGLEARAKYVLSGINSLSSLEPSSGGMGSKLKNIKKIFRYMAINIMYSIIPVGEKYLKIPANITAKIKLLIGPASAVCIPYSLGLSKLRSSTGTGLPQPNTGKFKPNILSTNRPTNKVVPTGSQCLSGFNDIRPSILAVGSPNKLATKA